MKYKISLIFIVLLCYTSTFALPGRDISNIEMSRVIGRAPVFEDCCEEDTHTECNQEDECPACYDKVSGLEDCDSGDLDDPSTCRNDGKNYAETNYIRCERDSAFQNELDCFDQPKMTCWTEHYCGSRPIELDSYCWGEPTESCESIGSTSDSSPPECGKCRECYEKSELTGNKHEVTPQDCQ